MKCAGDIDGLPSHLRGSDLRSDPRWRWGSFVSFSTVSWRKVIVGCIAASLLAASSPALAERRDAYDPREAGHPVKIASYLLYPIGFIVDILILRPAHWLGQHEPFNTVFGVDARRSEDAEAEMDPEMPTTAAPDEIATD